MRKLKIFIGIAVLTSLVIILSACGADDKKPESGSSAPSQAPVQGTQAQGKSASPVEVAISPPAGWEKAAGSTVPIHYMKKGASFIVKQEKFQSNNLDEVVNEAKAIYAKAFEDVKYEGEPQALTLDGKDARKIRFTCKIGGMQMKYEYVYVSAGGGIQVITFGAETGTFGELAADYEKILADIRF